MRFLTTAAFLALTLSANAQVKWDLPAAYAAGNFHSENLVAFANAVDKATDGKLKITVHANASLFKATEIKRAVQGAQAPLGEILLANFENENPLFGMDGIPFLATGYADAKKLYAIQKPALDKLLGAQGMRTLFCVAWPPQGIYANKILGSVADMKGLKWRAYSPATARMADLIQAQPVQIQAAELSQALATGVVNSYISSGSTGYDSKTYESIKYFHNTEAWLPKNCVIMNNAAFDALDKPSQAALLKAGADAEEAGWKLSTEKNGWYLEQLKLKGMEIVTPAALLTSDFKKIGDTMLTDWLAKAGADGKALVDAFKK
jgi:TRAP-type transport system periplasmic protein